ncbi:hypothetical protein ACHAPZ_011298 [Fusarium culmorum]
MSRGLEATDNEGQGYEGILAAPYRTGNLTTEYRQDVPNKFGFPLIVPDQDVTLSGGTTVRCFVRGDTFPDNDRAKIAAEEFQAATDSRAKLKSGLAFS